MSLKKKVAVWLAAAIGVFGVCVFTGDAPSRSLTPTAALALRLDNILDELPEPAVVITPDSVNAWTLEILPFFEYEGITAFGIWPESVTLTAAEDAMHHMHVLGTAACTPAGGGPIMLNARVANPVSAWYGRPSFLATLVHEIGHIQGGGLCDGPSDRLESTTQLATLEVLAAMANGGNKVALYALFDEFRDMLMAAAQYEAMKNGSYDEFLAFQKRIYSEPNELARSAKAARRWRSDPDTLKSILFRYNAVPVSKVLAGLEKQVIPELYLPELVGSFSAGNYQAVSATRALVIDDLAYVLEHAEELAETLAEPPH